MSDKKVSNRYKKLHQLNEIQAAATKHINFSVIVFLLIFTYMLIVMISFAVHERVNYTIVEEGTLSYSKTFTGMVVRDEEVIAAKQSGIFRSFVLEGSRVRKNARLFGIIEDAETLALLDEQIKKLSSSLDDALPSQIQNSVYLKDRIKTFTINQNYEKFGFVYDERDRIAQDVLRLQSTYEFDESTVDIDSNLENKLSLVGDHITIVTSPSTGVVSFNLDGLEDIKMTSNVHDFDYGLLQREVEDSDQIDLLTEVNNGTAVCRIIDGYKWYLIAEIDDENEKLLDNDRKDGTFVTKMIEFPSLNMDIIGKVYKPDDVSGKTYVIIEFDRDLQSVINERFLNFSIYFDNYDGLKIPNSAVIDKEFVKVPEDYLVKLGSEYAVYKNVVSPDAPGGNSVEMVKFSLKLQDDVEEATNSQEGVSYVYIPLSDQLKIGDTIRKITEKEENDDDELLDGVSYESMTLMETKDFPGVYMVNRGYAMFKLIDPLYITEDYQIIARDTQYGIRVYDRIATEGNDTSEYEIVY